MKLITICINWKEHEQWIHDTCSVFVMPLAKGLSLNNILASKNKSINKYAQDFLINPESVVCSYGKLELKGK